MQRCSGKANTLRYIYIYIHHKRGVEGHRHQGTENLQYQNQNYSLHHTFFNKLYRYESISLSLKRLLRYQKH